MPTWYDGRKGNKKDSRPRAVFFGLNNSILFYVWINADKSKNFKTIF